MVNQDPKDGWARMRTFENASGPWTYFNTLYIFNINVDVICTVDIYCISVHPREWGPSSDDSVSQAAISIALLMFIE